MKTKFTPGPWKIGSYDDDGDLAIVTKKQTIALLDQRMIDSKAMIDDDINKANATLIAAAPEMFETLEAIKERLESWVDYHQARILNLTLEDTAKDVNTRDNYKALINTIEFAIKKARGE